MSNTTQTARQFHAAASKLGISIPGPVARILEPDAHPRQQLADALGTPTTPETAVWDAVAAGKDPAKDRAVAAAFLAADIWKAAGDLDARHDRNLSGVFADQWPDIVNAVKAVFDPAAEQYTNAHDIINGYGLNLDNTDELRRIGGDALLAWSQALHAEETLKAVPALLTAAHLTANPSQYGNLSRMLWTVQPNLDTWLDKQPKVSDIWAVVSSGATLDLADDAHEAEQRALLVHRERALAHEARRAASAKGGFGGEAQQVTYIGADGKTRRIDSTGAVRNYIEGVREDLPAGMVTL